MPTRTIVTPMSGGNPIPQELTSSNENFDTINLEQWIGVHDIPSNNQYPLLINNSQQSRVRLIGGRGIGTIAANNWRQNWYGGNNKFNGGIITIENIPCDIIGLKIGYLDDDAYDKRVCDAIRVKQGCDGTVLDGVITVNTGDDVIESDSNISKILVKNSFHDHVFTGYSATHINAVGKEYRLQNVMMRCTRRFADANATNFAHGPPFKVGQGTVPCKWILEDSVIAVSMNNYGGAQPTGRMFEAFNNMDGAGNKFLFLGLANRGTHPLPPSGVFETVYGQEAIQEWEAAKASFFATTPPDPVAEGMRKVTSMNRLTGELTTLCDRPLDGSIRPLVVNAYDEHLGDPISLLVE